MISQQFKLSIEGMHCASCVATIEKGLRKIPGVLSASVNLGLEQAVVSAQEDKVKPEQLIQTIQTLGYKAKPFEPAKDGSDPYKKECRDWLWRLLLALPFTLILMIFTGKYFWLDVAFGGIVYFVAGFPFLKGMIVSLWRRHPDMNALIGIGATAAYLYGYFETTATLLSFLILGRFLEAKAKRATSQSLRALFQSIPQIAHRKVKDGFEDLSPESLGVGDIILINPGEKVPADGEIIDGVSSFDESLITGESFPVYKRIGEKVFAGIHNQDGAVTVRVSKNSGETYLAQIATLVESALANKAPIERLADKISGIFVPIVLLIAFVTFWFWWNLGPEPKLANALEFAVAVLIIACPCALGLATPTAVIAGVGKGAKHGILIKGGDVLEKVRDLHTIVLDKTGTLTEGRPRVKEVIALSGNKEEVLKLAAQVEIYSEHLLAHAIIREARIKGLHLAPLQNFKNFPGLGTKAHFGDNEVLVGSPVLFAENGITISPLAELAEEKRELGFNVIFVALNQKLLGAIVLEDEIKENSMKVIQKLKEMEFNVWMITGDQKAAAELVAQTLGISKVLSSMKPDEKASAIAELKKEGLGIAFVGDGINDAPALAAADVGIAFATGSDITKAASDITLVHGDPLAIVEAIKLAKKTYAAIQQNLWLSFIYNVLAIPIAAGVLYSSFKLRLTPEIAAIAMSLSSISVVLNSLRLKWTRVGS